MKNYDEISLYIDMDGTLTEFIPAENMGVLYEKGYFLNLKPLKNVISGIRCFMRKYPDIKVCILSAYLGDSKWALMEKKLWLIHNFPELLEVSSFVKYGAAKSAVPAKGEKAFLLDDHSPNLIEWESAATNFFGIKLLNGINGAGKKWNGDAIRYDLPSEDFANRLHEIMVKAYNPG